MASLKRPHIDIDPDYEDVSEAQTKRRRVLEEGAKEATKRKIESIIKKQFETEIQNKQNEILKISQTLEMSRSVMDRLRAVIVANYYSNASQQKSSKGKHQDQTPVIHPTVKKFIGKAPPGTPHLPDPGRVKVEVPEDKKQIAEMGSERIGQMVSKTTDQRAPDSMSKQSNPDDMDTRNGRFRMKRTIIVGNVSKSIPADQRDENDQATHKWMVYVRGPKERPSIDDFVQKVWFFLHPSYRPNDLVEVSSPPFHLTRRGWGEFPVRVQIHFKDNRNKKMDIIHNLKLDRTYTGLQTLGAETVVNVELERDVSDIKQEKKTKESSHRLQGGISNSHGTVVVKQEPGITQEQVNSGIGLQGSCIVPEVKTEPIDHDYGQAITTVPNVSMVQPLGTGGVVVKVEQGSNLVLRPAGGVSAHCPVPSMINPIQTVVSSSIVTTQALSLIPIATGAISNNPNILRVTPHTTPTKDPLRNEAASPGVKISNSQSPSRNIVLQGFGSITSSSFMENRTNLSKNSSPTIITQNSNITPLSASPGKVNLTGAQTLIKAASTPVTHFGSKQTVIAQQNKQTVIQSPNSGLYFLKCTDNQGKTYLIPQQGCTSVSPAVKGNNTTPVKVNTSAGASVLLSPTNIGPQIQQRVVPTLSGGKLSDVVPQGKQTAQNGPVLFIKPDSSICKTTQSVNQPRPVSLTPGLTPVRLGTATGLQVIRGVSQNQNINVVNLKTANQSTVNASENQSVVKGQLKVTPQGLIHVQGQSSRNLIVNKGDTAVNGENSSSSQPKQPVVLVPNNNKVSLLPGRAKSLLNPVLNSLAVTQSNGNIILLNQSNSLLSNGNVVQLAPSSLPTNQNRIKTVQAGKSAIVKGNVSQSDMLVLQTTSQAKPVNNSTPNHLVIIPVTSDKSVAMTTTCQSVCSSQSTILVSSSAGRVVTSSSGKMLVSSQQRSDKTMFIVVQGDKAKGANSNCVNTSGTAESQVSMASLLGPRPMTTVGIATSAPQGNCSESSVLVSGSKSKQKQIIVVNRNDSSAEVEPSTSSLGPQKKIINLKKKKTQVVDVIPPLSLGNYSDMLSLVQAAVLRHPVVSETASRTLHPYCARSTEHWLSWSLGKKRSSEWQRASSVRRYISSYLGGSTEYKGESLWSTRQILTWCRLHAYSPHYLEKPLHPTGVDLQAETSLISEKQHRKFSSVTGGDQIVQEVTSLMENVTVVDSSDDEIDILSIDKKRVKVKKETELNPAKDVVEYLPLTEGTPFVDQVANKIGVRLDPTEVEPGLYGTVAQGMMYTAMESFLGDILRETFALKVNMGRYPDALGVADVYSAINSLGITDFLSNKYLGVEESQTLPTSQR